MTPSGFGVYDAKVAAFRRGVWRWGVAGALLCCAVFGAPQAAYAGTASFDVGDQAVVQVIGRAAQIVIRTWNRNTVRVDWPDGEPFAPVRSTQQTRSSFLIPTVTVAEYTTPTGSVMTTLLPEDFPVPNLTVGMHDVVRVQDQSPAPQRGILARTTHVTVTIPASTGLVNVRAGRGSIALSDYRGTTIAVIGRGRIVLRNVGGDAFMQPLNGRFYAVQSDFDRLRIRSNHADQIFDSCRVKQIEATTLTGNIVFDDGSFGAGLARFESDRGSIALGINGGAQLGAHTQDGHVFTMLPPAQAQAPVFGTNDGDTNGEAVRLVGSGGPLVNASTIHGSVFLYDGSLADRQPKLFSGDWRPFYTLLMNTRRNGRNAPPESNR